MPAAISEDENLWSRILDDVQSRSSNSMPQAAILVLGDNDSGKTTLVARLQRVEDPKKGSGLEYHYLEVNPDFRDGLYAYQLGSALPDVVPGESARLGVWVLDGDPIYSPLIRFALTPDNLERCVILLCGSMAEPWSLLESLQRWSKILESHFALTSYDKNLLRECRDRQTRFWQEYVEPLDSSSHSETGAKVPSMETDHILLPLGETTLINNIGLPIVVVITKCDAMSTLEKDFDFKDEHFDFLQQHVRKFCLRFGAALIYTSVKESRNCDVLYKYLLHRVYGFPFTQPALVVEKDAVFIPAGWDNAKKISILFENLVSMKPEDNFDEHIKKPLLRRPMPRDAEVQVENEQTFLSRQLNILNTQAPPPPIPPTRPESSPTLQPKNKNVTSPPNVAQTSSLSTTPTSKKPDSAKTTPNAAGTNQEGVLAQFFNNLLNKKTAGASSSPNLSSQKSLDRSNLSNEAVAQELDRMLGDGSGNGQDSSAEDHSGNESSLNNHQIESAPESTTAEPVA